MRTAVKNTLVRVREVIRVIFFNKSQKVEVLKHTEGNLCYNETTDLLIKVKCSELLLSILFFFYCSTNCV